MRDTAALCRNSDGGASLPADRLRLRHQPRDLRVLVLADLGQLASKRVDHPVALAGDRLRAVSSNALLGAFGQQCPHCRFGGLQAFDQAGHLPR